ncbi:MAG: hypothetical protein AAFY71_22110 [Bacteroidota bacterium]
MKNLLILTLMLSVHLTSSFGQGIWLKGGLITQFSRPNGLNYVVDRYNETRSFLTTEMKPFNNLNGYSYGFMVNVENLFFEASYDHRSQNRFARGIDATNQEVERQIRASINSFGFGFGYGVIDGGFGFAIGGRANAGPLRVRTKIGTINEVRSLGWEEDDVFNQLHIDLDLNIKLILRYLVIEPYYSIQLVAQTNNMAEVNEQLNPNTFQNDPETIPFQSGGFGLKFIVLLGGYEAF